jgi:hypothetical protein
MLAVFSVTVLSVTAWTPEAPHVGRRSFLQTGFASSVAAAAVGVATMSSSPTPAFAYERRDVGGENSSPETAAFNIQAYETNNRLEREGMKLETQAEQQASLTAALKDYPYSTPAPSSKTAKGSSKKKKTTTSAKTKASVGSK